MPRFSLKWMLAGVAAVALGCVALLYASSWVFAITLGIALLLLLTAPLGIAYRTGGKRAFWIGFAVFGWCYYLALMSGASTTRTAFRALPTNEAYVDLYNLMPKRTEKRADLPGRLGTRTVAIPEMSYFRRVFHSLFIILLGVVGGAISRSFYATRNTRDK